MSLLKPVCLLLCVPLALAACDSGQPSYSAANTPAPPPSAVPAQPAPAPADTPPPPPAQPTAVAAAARPVTAAPASPMTPSAQAIRLPPPEQVGIGSCDDYISRYRACLETNNSGLVVSAQRKYQLAQMLARQVRQWNVQLKKGGNGDIANACREANTAAKELLSGCHSF